MNNTNRCPDLEQLNAFLAGKLKGNDKRKMIAHLDQCPDCFVLLAQAVHFEQEEKTGEGFARTRKSKKTPSGHGAGSGLMPRRLRRRW